FLRLKRQKAPRPLLPLGRGNGDLREARPAVHFFVDEAGKQFPEAAHSIHVRTTSSGCVGHAVPGCGVRCVTARLSLFPSCRERLAARASPGAPYGEAEWWAVAAITSCCAPRR